MQSETVVPGSVDKVGLRLSGPWIWLSIGAALMAAVGSAVGLADGQGIYGKETTTLADAAAAQDVVNLCLVAPLTVVLGLRARAGSVRGYLCWVGCLAFTVYNYAIYAFSIHFGPLFLVWVAVLGLSFYAIVGSLATTDSSAIKDRFQGRALPLTSWVLIGLAILFLFLWLSEIAPDLLAGTGSRSASDWKVPTNPVHVLDLAFFLPAVLLSGVLLLRRHPFGYLTSVGGLLFMVLTCLPIVITPLVASLRGHEPGWAVLAPIGIVLAATTVALFTASRSIRDGYAGLELRQASAGSERC